MLEILVILAVLSADQVSKALCASWLPGLTGGSYTIIKDVFYLFYTENRGASFGILQNARWFFIAVTIIFCTLIALFMIKERKNLHRLMRLSLSLILAGAIGNFIDRLFLGFVRDMFYFKPINFPVFNLSDTAITIGATLLILDILFFRGKDVLSSFEKRFSRQKKDGDAQ